MQACQADGNYELVMANAGLDRSLAHEMQYTMLLPCASNLFAVLNILADVIFTIDILLNFITGYIPHRRSEAKYDLRGIARSYIKGPFTLDLIATLPWNAVSAFYLPAMACMHVVEMWPHMLVHLFPKIDKVLLGYFVSKNVFGDVILHCFPGFDVTVTNTSA